MLSGQDLAIRRITERDIPFVVDIERRSFSKPWSEEMFLTEIRMDHVSYFYVATLMDVIVGYGGFWLVSDEVHLVNLCVDKPYRRCGIATTLLRFLLSRGAEKGARYSTLEVRSSNTPAINLYRSFGFREVAIRKGYYTDTGEDAIVMLLDNLGKKRY